MNHSTAIFLVNDDVRAIATSYEVYEDGAGKRPFVVYKSMDPNLKVGQYVVVPTDTRHKMTVVRVEEVDVEVALDSPTHMHWIVADIHTGAYDALVKMEKAGIEKIKSAEKAAAKKALHDKLLADNPDIAALANISVAEQPALAAPPANKE